MFFIDKKPTDLKNRTDPKIMTIDTKIMKIDPKFITIDPKLCKK